MSVLIEKKSGGLNQNIIRGIKPNYYNIMIRGILLKGKCCNENDFTRKLYVLYIYTHLTMTQEDYLPDSSRWEIIKYFV